MIAQKMRSFFCLFYLGIFTSIGQQLFDTDELIFMEVEEMMWTVRYVQMEDKNFWFERDPHLSEQVFEKKVKDRMGYVLLEKDVPVGILRYNLFWDNTPFCTMLFIDSEHQHNGYGTALMDFWETEMVQQGYGMVMTSTQVDEEAQHFYRKMGYQDAGSLVLTIPKYKQPMEMFLVKEIGAF